MTLVVTLLPPFAQQSNTIVGSRYVGGGGTLMCAHEDERTQIVDRERMAMVRACAGGGLRFHGSAALSFTKVFMSVVA